MATAFLLADALRFENEELGVSTTISVTNHGVIQVGSTSDENEQVNDVNIRGVLDPTTHRTLWIFATGFLK